MNDDFYVGYLPQTAPALARRVRQSVWLLLLVFLGCGVLLVGSMAGFSRATFEFGNEREFEGVIVEGPSPMLILERPGVTTIDQGTSDYLLVGMGKHGATTAVAGMHGKRVGLRGTLIYRDDQALIELSSDPIDVLGDGRAILAGRGERELGQQTLTGEIVDSKCFAGVMKPGNLKPHRACAVRCISGGIPPVLLVRDADGFASYYLLLSSDGQSVNAQVLHRVAEPVRIEGRVVLRGGRLFLYADPASYSDVL